MKQLKKIISIHPVSATRFYRSVRLFGGAALRLCRPRMGRALLRSCLSRRSAFDVDFGGGARSGVASFDVPAARWDIARQSMGGQIIEDKTGGDALHRTAHRSA